MKKRGFNRLFIDYNEFFSVLEKLVVKSYYSRLLTVETVMRVDFVFMSEKYKKETRPISIVKKLCCN